MPQKSRCEKRFGVEELKDVSENENTKKSTEYYNNVFKMWANERDFQANLKE